MSWLEGITPERRRRRKQPEPEPAAEAPPDGLPVVTWFPIYCPGCESRRHKCDGTHGRVRWHDCQDCGLRFKSVEVQKVPRGGNTE